MHRFQLLYCVVFFYTILQLWCVVIHFIQLKVVEKFLNSTLAKNSDQIAMAINMISHYCNRCKV